MPGMSGELIGKNDHGLRRGFHGGGWTSTRDANLGGASGGGIVRTTIGLGLFSIGLGVAELIATRGLHRLLGLRPRSRSVKLARALGVRELAAGVGLLISRRPARWLWARVVGDVMDLAVLGAAVNKRDARSARVGTAIGAVAAIAAIDAYAAVKAGNATPRLAPPVRKAVTIARPVEEVFAFWRDLSNLPKFMARVSSVERLGPERARWTARGPLGKTITWDAELTAERPNELIAWRSSDDAQIASRGEVRFRQAEGEAGTAISIELAYEPPAGALGHLAAPLAHQALAVELDRGLRRLKQLLEVGEILHSDASVHAGRHAARPSGTPDARRFNERSRS